MQGFAGDLVESILALPEAFGAVAANDPIGAVLLLVGFAFLALSGGAVGYLVLGATLEAVTPT